MLLLNADRLDRIADQAAVRLRDVTQAEQHRIIAYALDQAARSLAAKFPEASASDIERECQRLDARVTERLQRMHAVEDLQRFGQEFDDAR